MRAQTTLKTVQSFDVTFPGYGGHPIKGWLILPTTEHRSAPPRRAVHRLWRRPRLAHEQLHWAASGFAYFRMDTRGQGSDWSVGETADPVGSTSSIPGFMTRGVLDKNDYYYRRLFTDAVRAIDALLGLNFVDPERIAVCGDSQGGGISLAVGGIDPRVKAVMPDVPFLCDFPRAVQTAVRDPYLESFGFWRSIAKRRRRSLKRSTISTPSTSPGSPTRRRCFRWP